MADRILLLHYTTPSIIGGVEQVMGVHATALRAAGAEVAIVAGRGRPSPPGVPLVRIPEIDSRCPEVLRSYRALARGRVPPGHGELTERIHRALGPHVAAARTVVAHNVFTLHKNHALTAALARLAAEYPGRFVAWTHDLAWVDPQYDAERHAGEPWDLFARALPGVRYVAVSRARAAQFSALSGTPESEIEVVPNGIDLGAVLALSAAGARLASRLGLHRFAPIMLVPARITRRKRIEAAIAATRALRQRGLDPALIVTGPLGAHNPGNRAYLDALVRAAQGDPGVFLLHAMRVRVTARVLADLYALADVLLLPSQSEGFGIPILEAGVRGTPIVCSDLPSLRELAGSDAWYVSPDAPGEAIADAVTAAVSAERPSRLRSRMREFAWPRILPRALAAMGAAPR